MGASNAPKWLYEASSDTEKAISIPAQGQENTEAKVIETPEADNAGGPVGKAEHSEEAMKWTAKGNADFNRGAMEEAIKAFNTAIQIDPQYGVPYSNLALTYLTQGQFAEAILLYQKSVELLNSDRDKALSWNGLGNAYRCTGDYAKAVAAYQQAAELDPETGGIRDQADSFQPRAAQRSAKGWNNLGELLLKTGALDKAIEAFLKAIEREPTFGRAFFNLARAHAAAGEYGEAVPFYEKSIALLESDREKAEAWNGLGNAYRKMNDYDKAISAYKKAVVLADEKVDLLTRARFSLLSNVFVHQ